MVTGVILGGWCLGVALAGPLGTPKIPPILTPILGQIHVKSASKLYLYGGHSGGCPGGSFWGGPGVPPKPPPIGHGGIWLIQEGHSGWSMVVGAASDTTDASGTPDTPVALRVLGGWLSAIATTTVPVMAAYGGSTRVVSHHPGPPPVPETTP